MISDYEACVSFGTEFCAELAAFDDQVTADLHITEAGKEGPSAADEDETLDSIRRLNSKGEED